MLDRMWGMMRLTPFGAAFPGAQPGAAQGFVPSLSMMSDMMAPLTNVEELDKRITDMRAVEQWLKLNLNMLQSAIQALEVQRATLATLRAFGAFAQSSMSQPAVGTAPSEPAAAAWSPAAEADANAAQAAGGAAAQDAGGTPPPGFDASGWWNLLQSQFNQIAQFAMAQPGSAAAEGQTEAGGADDERRANGKGAAAAGAHDDGGARPTAAKRTTAKRPAGAKRSGTAAAKKAPGQPE
jgi:hypothetical protein